MVKTRILLLETNNGYLDVKDGTSFPINFSIGDIRDLSKRNGNYSNTVTIVGNSNSHNLLNHYYDVNIQAGTFNVNTLQKCLVEQDGVVILDNMYLQLTGVKKLQKTGAYEEQVEYTVEIKDSSADFFVKISNLELTDISLSAFNHTYTTSAVTESFDNTWVDGYKYRLPYQQDSNLYQLKDFNPCIYNKIYFDKIFDNAGFTYEFEEASGSTIQFDKLLIPWNGDIPKPADDQSIWVEAHKSSGVTKTVEESFTYPSRSPIILDVEDIDASGYYNPVTGEYTVPTSVIAPDSYEYEFVVNYDFELYNDNAFDVIAFGNLPNKKYGLALYANNAVGTGVLNVAQNQAIAAGDTLVLGSNIEQTITVNISDVTAGSIITNFYNTWTSNNQSQVWVNDDGGTPFQRYITNRVIINSISVRIKPALETFVFGSTVNLGTFIPKKIKQSDYVKSILMMSNAYVETDRNNPTNLIIKTRDKFYDDGVVVDWTQKLAKDREQNVKFLPELSSKRLILSYKPDKDTANANYESITNEVYGQVEYIFDNEYVKNIEKRELIFSPTPNAYTEFQANVPLIIGQAPKTNIRILLDNGLYSCQPYTITETGTTVSTTEYSVYPLLSHFNDAENPTFDINFATCDYYFYSPDSLTNNNLYNLHYRRTLSQINNGKLLSAYFNLNSVDIQQMRMNDKIRIDNSYWNINKLTYDANSTNLTLVELISVDDELELVDLNTFGITESSPTGTVILPAPGDTILKDLGKIKNNTGKGKIDYSNIDASNGNVKFNGLYNQTSNLTSGFVQGDYNQITAAGKVYVDGNNNTVQSSAYVIGTSNVVEENLENVFLFIDNYTATTSQIIAVPSTVYINESGDTQANINGILIDDLDIWQRSGTTDSAVMKRGGHVIDSGSTFSIMAGGYNNIISASTIGVSIIGGHDNLIDTGVDTSSIIGGYNNLIEGNSDDTVLLGTTSSTATTGSVESIIAGGYQQLLDAAPDSAIIGGGENSIVGADATVVLGGYNIAATASETVYVPNLNVNYVPQAADGTETLLVRAADGTVKESLAVLSAITASSGLTWADVLANGNTSGPNDAIMNSGQKIKGEAITGPNLIGSIPFLDFDSNANNSGIITLSNDDSGGLAQALKLNGANGEVQLLNDIGLTTVRSSSQTKLEAANSVVYLNINQLGNINSNAIEIGLDSSNNQFEILINDNTTDISTSGPIDKKAIFIGTNNSTIDAGVVNSVIIGGNDNLIESYGALVAASDSSEIQGPDAYNSVIIGGASNVIASTSPNSGIFAGSSNSISGAQYTAIIGGDNISATYDNTVYQQDSYRDAHHTVQTTNNTTTDIYTFVPDTNGVWMIEANTTGFETATGDAIGAKSFAVFKNIGGTVTQVSTNTLDRKSNFPASVTVVIDTDGTNIRVRVTGRTGSNINWKCSLTLTK